MQIARTVAGFAAIVFTILALGNQPRMIRRLKTLAQLIVALLAFDRADVLGAGHIRENHRLPRGAAGNDGQQQHCRAGCQQLMARPRVRF
jgi:hypothetical protein